MGRWGCGSEGLTIVYPNLFVVSPVDRSNEIKAYEQEIISIRLMIQSRIPIDPCKRRLGILALLILLVQLCVILHLVTSPKRPESLY